MFTRALFPVDEVVTATLFHREDDMLKLLMLSEEQASELDQLWEDLYFVSEEPLKLVVSLEQIREFSTQDRQELVPLWDKMKPVVKARAVAFAEHVVETQPIHLQSVLDFADQAWRRDLTYQERQQLRDLYDNLRGQQLEHETAIRLLIARVLTSPAFLYRREKQHDGSQPARLQDLELANRLSYFLWSSMPDPELRSVAEAGRLARRGRGAPHQENATSRTDILAEGELIKQTHRMLKDPRTRRLAIQFACQWLHLRGFETNDQKNEELFPEFAQLRGEMYEETVRFFEDMFRNNGSILELLDADHTFLNESLAKFYGFKHVKGNNWRRVGGVKIHGRGGVLGMATMLASQSGVSRTSPILRGNWISETLLGERLPRPPANVPQLPDRVPSDLTAREMIEHHSADARVREVSSSNRSLWHCIGTI